MLRKGSEKQQIFVTGPIAAGEWGEVGVDDDKRMEWSVGVRIGGTCREALQAE
jgi:hypothetical protein